MVDQESCGGFAKLERQCFFGWASELRLTAAITKITPPEKSDAKIYCIRWRDFKDQFI
jgi:hypothetical protein